MRVTVAGQVREVLTVGMDVTAPVGARHRLEENGRLLRTPLDRMIEAATAAMSFLNRDLVYEWANARHGATLPLADP